MTTKKSTRLLYHVYCNSDIVRQNKRLTYCDWSFGIRRGARGEMDQLGNFFCCEIFVTSRAMFIEIQRKKQIAMQNFLFCL